MATALILRTLVTFCAVLHLSRVYADETCGHAASPGTERRNSSLQCGVSLEDELSDNQVGLLQVELQIGNGTKEQQLHAQKAKKLGKEVAGKFWVSLLGSKGEYLQDSKMAAAGASLLFVLGLVCIGAIMACMLLEAFSDNALDAEYRNPQKGHSPQQLQRQGPYQSTQEVHRKSASPIASDVSPRSPGPSPTAPTFGGAAAAASQYVSAAAGSTYPEGSVQMGYAQPAAHGNAPGFVDVSASRSPRPAPAPVPSMGHSPRTSPTMPAAMPTSPSPRTYQETPGAGYVAPGHALMMSQQMPTPSSSVSPRLQPQSLPYGLPSGHAEGSSTPRGRSPVSGQRAAKPREVFEGAGTPAIASTMIMPSTPVFLTIPMNEMSGVVQGSHIEKLVIFSSKGKPMLFGKVDTKDGGPAFMFSSVGGDLPRVYIKPRARGTGETLDVLDARGDHYGTLTHSGDSLATLSNQANQPIMKINKVPDRSMLEMQATTMDGKAIANASPDAGNWKLTVGPGVDAVLICACMVGIIFFWRESK